MRFSIVDRLRLVGGLPHAHTADDPDPAVQVLRNDLQVLRDHLTRSVITAPPEENMTDARWNAIRSTPGRPGANWSPLPENGWGAVIAYVAGPGRARPHDAPLTERTVEVTTVVDGASKSLTLPMTPEDVAVIAEFVDTHLEEVGIPPAPVTWWEIDLPDGMTYETFDLSMERALKGLHASGKGTLEEEYRAIAAVVQGLHVGG